MAERTEALFKRAGALKDGHFLLKSGRHSERYLEKFLLLQDPAVTSQLCSFWAAAARGSDGEPLVDLVAGPTTGGIVLAFETARQLGVRGIFAEEVRDADGTAHREFRRGFRIEPGERVLLVDDILTTGGSLLAMLPPVESAGGEIVGCFVMADRSGGTAVLAIADDRPALPGPGPLAAGDPDVRARSKHLSGVCRRDSAPRAREHRHRRTLTPPGLPERPGGPRGDPARLTGRTSAAVPGKPGRDAYGVFGGFGCFGLGGRFGVLSPMDAPPWVRVCSPTRTRVIPRRRRYRTTAQKTRASIARASSRDGVSSLVA